MPPQAILRARVFAEDSDRNIDSGAGFGDSVRCPVGVARRCCGRSKTHRDCASEAKSIHWIISESSAPQSAPSIIVPLFRRRFSIAGKIGGSSERRLPRCVALPKRRAQMAFNTTSFFAGVGTVFAAVILGF